MNIIKNFPKDKKCPLCGRNENKSMVLIPIEGTQRGYTSEAIPAHLDCILDGLWYYPKINIMAVDHD